MQKLTVGAGVVIYANGFTPGYALVVGMPDEDIGIARPDRECIRVYEIDAAAMRPDPAAGLAMALLVAVILALLGVR